MLTKKDIVSIRRSYSAPGTVEQHRIATHSGTSTPLGPGRGRADQEDESLVLISKVHVFSNLFSLTSTNYLTIGIVYSHRTTCARPICFEAKFKSRGLIEKAVRCVFTELPIRCHSSPGRLRPYLQVDTPRTRQHQCSANIIVQPVSW